MIEQKRPIQYSNIRIDFMQRFRLSVSDVGITDAFYPSTMTVSVNMFVPSRE